METQKLLTKIKEKSPDVYERMVNSELDFGAILTPKDKHFVFGSKGMQHLITIENEDVIVSKYD